MRRSRQQDPMTPEGPVRPLDRVIVGIDFTEVSLAAAQWVGRQLAPDATLTLVHVIADPLLPNVAHLGAHRRGESTGLFRTRMESLRGALRGVADVIDGTRTGIEVRVGDPALQLAAFADLARADLVVIGGPSAFHAAPRLETATTDRLLRHLTQPVLVARPAPLPLTTVLAVLVSQAPARVQAFARTIAAPSGARVVTLRLSDRKSDIEYPPRERNSEGATPDLVALREQARMIINVAREQRAEVIVIGGSATAAGGDDDLVHMLARTATSSVLVVPQQADSLPRRPFQAHGTRHVQQPVAIGSQPDGDGPRRPAASICVNG